MLPATKPAAHSPKQVTCLNEITHIFNCLPANIANANLSLVLLAGQLSQAWVLMDYLANHAKGSER